MKYPKYTPSRIKWNHAYPAHWICEKAKRFFMNPKKLNKENKESNILSLTLSGVIQNNSSKPIGLSPSDYATYQIFNANELVFKLIDLNNISTSRVGIVTERGIMSSAYIRFAPRSFMNIRYFYYQYFDWYKRHIFNGLGEGVRQTLSGNDLRNIEILVPPLKEQDQISRYLDWKTSKINKFIKAKKKLITLLKEQKQNIINEAVTKGINPNVKMKDSGVAWIGEIPEHWEVRRCKFILRESNIRSVDGSEEHLSMSQKHGSLVKREELSERRLMSENYIGGKICNRGDIVLNRLKAHLGVFAVAQQTGVISPDYTVLKVMVEACPEFVECVLKSLKIRPELRIRCKGIVEGFWRLYTDDLYTLVLPLPSLQEQCQIMMNIANRSASIDQIIVKTEREIELIQEYRTRLVSDVVTGQVDVRSVKIPDFDSVEMEQEVEGDEEAEDELITESIEE